MNSFIGISLNRVMIYKNDKKYSSYLELYSFTEMELDNRVFVIDNLLSFEDFSKLKNYVKELTFDNPSFVYNLKENENVHETSVRKSKTVIVNDNKLLDFVREIVLVNFKSKYPDLELNVSLARNYITFIKYVEDDFFDWHQDFEKVVINGPLTFKEMHLLFCIEQPNKGGELLFRGENISKIEYDMQENRCIVFDKTIEHSGAQVAQGTKIIMTIDVYISSPMQTFINYYDQLSDNYKTLFDKFVKEETDVFVCENNWSTVEQLKKFRFPNDENIIPFLNLDVINGNGKYGDTKMSFQITPQGVIYAAIRVIGTYDGREWKNIRGLYYSGDHLVTSMEEYDCAIEIIEKGTYLDKHVITFLMEILSLVEKEKTFFEEYKIDLDMIDIALPQGNCKKIYGKISCPEIEITKTIPYTYWCNEGDKYSQLRVNYCYGLYRIKNDK